MGPAVYCDMGSLRARGTNDQLAAVFSEIKLSRWLWCMISFHSGVCGYPRGRAYIHVEHQIRKGSKYFRTTLEPRIRW